jgi:hypothetical protein
MNRLKICAWTIAALVCASPLALAQSGGNYQITQSVVASGGGQQSEGGSFSLSGTIGQSLAGVTSGGGGLQVGGGFWASPVPQAPTAAQINLSGRVFNGAVAAGIIRRVRITLLDTTSGVVRTTQTNQFGYYRFDRLEIGRLYVVRAQSKNYVFAPDTYYLEFIEDREELNFTGYRLMREDPK